MGSELPKRDESLGWPFCRRPGCIARHLPTVDCPPRGVWLVARFCPACTGAVYCVRHATHEYGRPKLTVVR